MGTFCQKKSSCYFVVWKWVHCLCLATFVSPEVLVQAWDLPSEVLFTPQRNFSLPPTVGNTQSHQPTETLKPVHCGSLAGLGFARQRYHHAYKSLGTCFYSSSVTKQNTKLPSLCKFAENSNISSSYQAFHSCVLLYISTLPLSRGAWARSETMLFQKPKPPFLLHLISWNKVMHLNTPILVLNCTT